MYQLKKASLFDYSDCQEYQVKVPTKIQPCRFIGCKNVRHFYDRPQILAKATCGCPTVGRAYYQDLQIKVALDTFNRKFNEAEATVCFSNQNGQSIFCKNENDQLTQNRQTLSFRKADSKQWVELMIQQQALKAWKSIRQYDTNYNQNQILVHQKLSKHIDYIINSSQINPPQIMVASNQKHIFFNEQFIQNDGFSNFTYFSYIQNTYLLGGTLSTPLILSHSSFQEKDIKLEESSYAELVPDIKQVGYCFRLQENHFMLITYSPASKKTIFYLVIVNEKKLQLDELFCSNDYVHPFILIDSQQKLLYICGNMSQKDKIQNVTALSLQVIQGRYKLSVLRKLNLFYKGMITGQLVWGRNRVLTSWLSKNVFVVVGLRDKQGMFVSKACVTSSIVEITREFRFPNVFQIGGQIFCNNLMGNLNEKLQGEWLLVQRDRKKASKLSIKLEEQQLIMVYR